MLLGWLLGGLAKRGGRGLADPHTGLSGAAQQPQPARAARTCAPWHAARRPRSCWTCTSRSTASTRCSSASRRSCWRPAAARRPRGCRCPWFSGALRLRTCAAAAALSRSAGCRAVHYMQSCGRLLLLPYTETGLCGAGNHGGAAGVWLHGQPGGYVRRGAPAAAWLHRRARAGGWPPAPAAARAGAARWGLSGLLETRLCGNAGGRFRQCCSLL